MNKQKAYIIALGEGQHPMPEEIFNSIVKRCRKTGIDINFNVTESNRINNGLFYLKARTNGLWYLSCVEVERSYKEGLEASIRFCSKEKWDSILIGHNEIDETLVKIQKDKPKIKEVKLNGGYSAIFSSSHPDEFKVGCQTFPVSILSELIEASKEVQSK